MNDMHETAQRLGAREAEGLDVDATARAVIERLRREPAERPTWTAPAWLRIAAAVVLLAGAGLALRAAFPGAGNVTHAPAHLVADDLGDLSAAELRIVLTTLDETLDLTDAADTEATLDDLDAQQLDLVLRSLEG